jgi:hypothetical protein
MYLYRTEGGKRVREEKGELVVLYHVPERMVCYVFVDFRVF